MNTVELTQRQKEWLETAGIPAVGDTLTKKQTEFLSLVGEMMDYLETKYQTGFRFSSCAAASVADPSVTLYAYQEEEYSPLGLVTAIRTVRDKTVLISDDYAAAYCRLTCQEQVADFFREKLGQDNVKVYARLDSRDTDTFDGSQSAEELLKQGIVSGIVNVNLTADQLSSAEQQALAEEWGGWVAEQRLHLDGNICFVSREQFDDLNDFNFDDVTALNSTARWFYLTTDSNGKLLCFVHERSGE